MSAMTVALSLENIGEASQSIDPVFVRSPQFVNAELSDRLGRETVIKIETFNPIKSFKGRGADYFMRQVPSGRTVVCASAGNFGQAIAYAGSARGVSVRVFAATTANTAKVARMRELGAQEAPAMALSWREGRPVSSQTTATMADGLAVRVPVPAAVEWMREYVDDMVLVSEESIWHALEVVRDTLGLLVEPSGAVGIAAALEYGRYGWSIRTIIPG